MEQRINALTSTRGFAALMVVIFHFGTKVFPFNTAEPLFTQGNLSVSYFFVLSGFVMYRKYNNTSISYRDFMKRRIARIVPLYILAILLSALFLLLFKNTRGTHFVPALLLNLSFLQAYIPGAATTINSPGWTLSVEMLFYLLFPVFLLFLKRRPKQFIRFVIALYIISQAMHLLMIAYLHPENSRHLHHFIYYNPVWHLNNFVIGMAGGHLYHRIKERHINLSALSCFVLIIILIVFRPVSFHNGMLAPLFMLFIVAITIKEPRLLQWQPLVFLGEISYGIYLLQEPVHNYITQLNDASMHWEPNLLFYVYVIVLLIAATLSYRYVETPLRRKINAIKL